MRPARELILEMGIDPDELLERTNRLLAQNKKNPRNPDICACGHPMARHTKIEGREEWVCQPSRMYCPCDRGRPVLRVEDTRFFLCRTQGPKFEHALMVGLSRLLAADKDCEWLDDPRTCDKCGTRCTPFPVPLTRSNGIAYEPSPRNALLCQTCYEDL